MGRSHTRRHGLLLIALATLSLAPATLRADDPKKQLDDYELFQLFSDTLDQVERNYVKDISRRELMDAAIQGILGKLDPYSNYIKPDEINDFRTSVESQFAGIGIRPEVVRGRLRIATPFAGTPAYRAGLEAGDTIVEVDGKPVEGIRSNDDAVKLLRGEPGTKVTLTVLRPRNQQRETVTLTREWIHVDTVLGDKHKIDDSWDFMLDRDKHIGYIRLTGFSRDTAQDLQKALEDLQKEGLKGLILDLRFNPGGLLTTAIEVCDIFIPSGRIVSTKGRNTPEKVWDARQEGTFEGFPMAVLVNGSSASASEIVSACLQDHGRAKVIGERTWGKGSVQNVIDLEGGKSALKLTTASYHRPSGKNIHRFPNQPESEEWGVMPDSGFEVKLTNDQVMELQRTYRERDILLAKADKPAADKPASGDKPAEAAEPAKDAAEDAKPAEATSESQPSTGGSTPETPSEGPRRGAARRPFVDPQMQKALDYLGQELAKAQ